MSSGDVCSTERHVEAPPTEKVYNIEKKFVSVLFDKLDFLSNEVTSTRDQINAYYNVVSSFKKEILKLVSEMEGSIRALTERNKELEETSDCVFIELRESIQYCKYKAV